MDKPVLPAKLMALAAVMVLALAACGDDGGSPFTISTTSTAATTTTSATTTSVATTTTTTSTTTTTVVPPTLGPPPLPLEFRASGLNIVAFGATPTDAIDTVRSYLGFDPTFDSGWVAAWGDYGVCPGNEYRQVEFGGLILKFTDDAIFQPAGTRHFFSWAYDGNPPGVTPALLDVGITVADLQSLHPAALLFGDDPLYGSTFRVDGAAAGEQLWGTLTGIGPADTITYLTGGWGCGE